MPAIEIILTLFVVVLFCLVFVALFIRSQGPHRRTSHIAHPDTSGTNDLGMTFTNTPDASGGHHPAAHHDAHHAPTTAPSDAGHHGGGFDGGHHGGFDTGCHGGHH